MSIWKGVDMIRSQWRDDWLEIFCGECGDTANPVHISGKEQLMQCQSCGQYFRLEAQLIPIQVDPNTLEEG